VSSARPPVGALFERPTLEVARAIIGWRLVRDAEGGGSEAGARRVGRIVEVEAYIGEDDLASHARFGRTTRNAVMYGPPGRAYVYLVYGMHDCLNIVTEAAGAPAALLVRAVEPLEGIAVMTAAREARAAARPRTRATAAATRRPAERDRPRQPLAARVASGPGLVCAAFGIDRRFTGLDLLDARSVLRLEPPPVDERPPDVATGPRIGIAYADEPWRSLPWRFADPQSPAVSRPTLRAAPVSSAG
jgi:DNA-3-methyladenine glycosylase